MNNPKKAKSSNYMELAVKEMKELLSGVETVDELESAMEAILRDKIRESFKNGIEVGMKKSGSRKFSRNTGFKKRSYRNQ